MRRIAVMTLYAVTVGLLLYASYHHIDKLAYVVAENEIYAGWRVLWEAKELFLALAATIGLIVGLAALAVAQWASIADTEEAQKKLRAEKHRYEQRAIAIVGEANEERETARRLTEQAEETFKAARAKLQEAEALYQQSASKRANLCGQVERLRRKNARLKGH